MIFLKYSKIFINNSLSLTYSSRKCRKHRNIPRKKARKKHGFPFCGGWRNRLSRHPQFAARRITKLLWLKADSVHSVKPACRLLQLIVYNFGRWWPQGRDNMMNLPNGFSLSIENTGQVRRNVGNAALNPNESRLGTSRLNTISLPSVMKRFGKLRQAMSRSIPLPSSPSSAAANGASSISPGIGIYVREVETGRLVWRP